MIGGARCAWRSVAPPAGGRNPSNFSRHSPLPPEGDVGTATLLERLRLQSLELVAVDGAGVEQGLRLLDLIGRPWRAAGDGANVGGEAVLRVAHRLRGAGAHPAAAQDHVGEHADQGEEDHQDDPERLGDAGDLMIAEQIAKDIDQQPEPDDEEEDLDEPEQYVAVTK